ncbi:MAG: FAD-binding oxidoreductase [Spirulinaceae cyanobacterium RM2_2_10]|nr:FAD-binding oxidoreductase [Spirulinaceae cyanobacterium RM2_2_10]
MSRVEHYLSQSPQPSLQSLRRADQLWQALRSPPATNPPPTVIATASEPSGSSDFDLAICGGTLGIMLAAAWQQRGWRVVLLERGQLRGRDQEWNVSRAELSVLTELELLDETELAQAIATEYNPARISFQPGRDYWVENVLNIGVDPVYLLATLKRKFLAAGGRLLEQTAFQAATVHPNGVQICAGEQRLTARLLVDAMGHFSPIARQMRHGAKPEGVCLVVGSCAQGYAHNDSGDLLVSFTPIAHHCQYFWEAFPARDGRTTYLFTYLDAQPERFSLEFLMDEYLRLLPEYQQIDRDALQFERFVFGLFPAYRQSPLRVSCDRLLPVGDSGGAQSPVSFGGFGSMLRHLQRLVLGVEEALRADALERRSLALLHALPTQYLRHLALPTRHECRPGAKPRPAADQSTAGCCFRRHGRPR